MARSGCTKVMGDRVLKLSSSRLIFLKLDFAPLQLRRLFRQLIFCGLALGYVVRHVHGANKLSARSKN